MNIGILNPLIILTFLSLFGVIAFLGFLIIHNQAKAQERERDYISAIMAKNLPEYAATRKQLSSTVKDRLKEMRIENELAINNARMFEAEDGRGINIT